MDRFTRALEMVFKNPGLGFFFTKITKKNVKSPNFRFLRKPFKKSRISDSLSQQNIVAFQSN